MSMFEQPKISENPSRLSFLKKELFSVDLAEIVERLRLDPDLKTNGAYNHWRDEEVEKINRSGNREEENVIFMLKDAKVRKDAGMGEEAAGILTDLFEIAHTMNDLDLLEFVKNEL